MALDDLLKIVPPPATLPPNVPQSDEDWSQVEAKLGIVMPQDYKDFISIYGAVSILGFVNIINPIHVKSENLEAMDPLRLLRQNYGTEYYPYPVYPDPSGLLLWGITDNGDDIFWQTIGSPEQWPIVIKMSRQPVFEEYPGPMSSFLAGLASGTITSAIIPYDALDLTLE